jgi:hypothetical protein
MLLTDNFPDVNNIELSFDYLTLDKRFDFEDENTQKFQDWLLGIWNDIHSISFRKTCSDQKCNYCK